MKEKSYKKYWWLIFILIYPPLGLFIAVLIGFYVIYFRKKEQKIKEEKLKILEQKSKIEEIEKLDLLQAREELKIINEKIKEYEIIEMESYSLFQPSYNFSNSSQYKAKLEDIRNQQKEMIKNKTAVNFFDSWTVDGSKTKGRKMTNDNIKIILRNFNADCEAAINKIKFNNLKTIEKRILNSFSQLNKLNEINQISITEKFLNLKMEELHLGYQYENQLEIEKDILREQREMEKENRKAKAEIERKKASIDKEIIHYRTALNELENKIIISKSENEIKEYKEKILEINESIERFKNEKEELNYRFENIGAGYVYIISNIGSFGENVFKIGVTRRLNPIERIMELSSASVPFKFDIHALIFSHNAYELEAELHNKFSKKRVNMINNRKEFFNITIEEIEEILKNHKELTFEFNKIAEAEEYRKTIILKEEKSRE